MERAGRLFTNRSDLSRMQDAAINLLATGRTVKDVAAVLGLPPRVISQWYNHNPAFRANLVGLRRDLEPAAT